MISYRPLKNLLLSLSLFILCLFFLEGEKKRERESKVDKKMHGVPFHRGKGNVQF